MHVLVSRKCASHPSILFMQILVRSCVPATPNEPQVFEHALHRDHSEKPAAENKFAVGKKLTILVSFF